MSVSLGDFKPLSKWEIDYDGEKFKSSFGDEDNPKYIIDTATGRRYLNESRRVIRIKCAIIALGTPFIHIPCGVLNMVVRIAKLFTGYHFWPLKQNAPVKGFTNNCLEFSKDELRIITQPFSIIGLQIASFYGIFNPYDGRKLYATIERAQYEIPLLAPCFQPEAEKHLLGGNIDIQNTF